jgi:hypothetical protein
VTGIVQRDGDQTSPSIWGERIVFLDDRNGGDLDVVLAGLDGVTVRDVTSGDAAAQGWPRIYGDYLAYRNPGEVVVELLGGARVFEPPLAAPGTGRLVLSSSVVAWEQDDAAGGTDVAWRRLADGAAGVTELRGGAGPQGAVAVSYDWVGWIDSDDPLGDSVHLVDTRNVARAATLRVPDHDPALGHDALVELSIWTSTPSLPPVIAVTVAPAGAADGVRQLVVVDAAGTVLARLDYESAKVNPHLFSDWVGFEDLTFTNSQVTLWRWTAPPDPLPELYIPSMTATEQRLHDLVVAGDWMKVVWAGREQGGDFDIYLGESDLPLDAGGGGSGSGDPASCDLPDDDAFAIVEVDRVTAKPSPWGTGLSLELPTNFLVCMDSVDVTSGWVAVGTRVVAAPGDFGVGEVHREARITVDAGQGAIGAVLAGKPGASLRMRLFVDGGDGNGASDGATCAERGDCPEPPTSFVRDASSSTCATAGGFGDALLLLFPAALLLGGRRRSRR